MRAAYLTAIRRIEIRRAPRPAPPRAGDVLLRVRRMGVCGSDVHYFTEGRIGSQVVEFPWIVGHECVATVEEVGKGVARVRVGDRVAIDPAVPCGACEECRRGRGNICPQLKFLGCPGQLPGCLQPFLTMPERNCFVVPDGLSDEEAVLLEPLAIALYAVQLSHLEQGETVAVLGSGPLGLLIQEVCRDRGARKVFASDIIAERVAVATRLGATEAFDHTRQDVVGEVRRAGGGRGVDVAFECAGEQVTLDQGVEVLRPAGRLVLVGIPRVDRVSFVPDLMRRKELLLQNVRRQNKTEHPAIELAASGRVSLRQLATHQFPLDRTQEAFDLVAAYRDGVVKAIISL